MAQLKSKAVKSKSSNSVLTKLSQNISKNASTAAFHTHIGVNRLKRGVKKGVYAKRKSIEVSSNDEGSRSPNRQLKFPRRPCLNEKRFLTSALKLLSKSTTSTQYPDVSKQNMTKIKKASKETKHRNTDTVVSHNTSLEKEIRHADKAVADKKEKRIAAVANVNTALQERKAHKAFTKENTSLRKEKQKADKSVELTASLEKEKRKKKTYKSKILNNNYGEDRIEVLQCKKNTYETPSVDSVLSEEDLDRIKWSEFLPRLVKPNEEEIKQEKEKKLSHLAREVAEGRVENEKKVYEEPATLVSEQRDAQFYNFFVDLLETTLSAYNMKSDYQTSPEPDLRSVVSSKITFEIEKAVADKLKVSPENRQSKYCSFDNKDCNVKLNQLEGKRIKIRPDSHQQNLATHRKNKPEFILNTYKNTERNFHSATTPQKKSDKKKKEAEITRQNLLSMIKEQLSKDSSNLFEEPTSLYQTLKTMARNKMKSQKTIRFEKPGVRSDYDRSKRKIPPVTKSKKHNQEIVGRTKSQIQKRIGLRPIARAEENSKSNHSLVVYSYHGHQNRARKAQNNQLNDINKRKDAFNMMQQVLLAVDTVCRRKRRNGKK